MNGFSFARGLRNQEVPAAYKYAVGYCTDPETKFQKKLANFQKINWDSLVSKSKKRA